jgi:hypothetical protein
MDIGGINRVRGPIKPPAAADIKKSTASATDRDPQGQAGQEKKKPTQLTPEQEKEALDRLNQMPNFSKAGLKAELIPQKDGHAAHLLVKDSRGQVLRHIPYDQIVEIYLNRYSDNPTGQLIRRAA